MRLSIRHETTYLYAAPAARVTQMVRLTPRGHTGQFVIDWRIDVDHDCRLTRSTDPFGNIVHSFTLDGPLDGFTIVSAGSVEAVDTSGVVTRPGGAPSAGGIPARHAPHRRGRRSETVRGER